MPCVRGLAEWEPIKDHTVDPFTANMEENAGLNAVDRTTGHGQTCRIGLVLYDNFELLDTFGPLEMFEGSNRLNAGCFTVLTIAETKRVKSSKGPVRRRAPLPSLLFVGAVPWPRIWGTPSDILERPYTVQGGGKLRGRNISPWDISRFKFVRNFPRNFQAAVRNKPAAKFSKMSCPTVA